MENRLIFFASAAEQLEGVDAPKSERTDDLKNAADDLARSKIEVKKGGRNAVSRARSIENSDDTPEFTKVLMKQGGDKVEKVAAEWEKNPNTMTAQKMNEAVTDLQNKIAKFEKRKFDNSSVESEIKKLAGLPGAKELFKDLKIDLKSKSTGGTINFEWKPEDVGNMKKFGLEQKKLIAEEMRKRLATPPEGVDNSKGAETLRDELLSNSEVPKSWKEWLQNPEKGFPGASEKQKTLGYVVGWMNKNLGELTAQTADFKAISTEAEADPKSAKQLSEKGVKTSVESFRELSRTERNEILGKYSAVFAMTNAALAERAAKSGVSDGADSENIRTKNTAEIKEAEAAEKAKAEELAPKLQKFSLDQKLGSKVDARVREMEANSKTADSADGVANLRQRAQSGESVGFGAKMKNLFSRKKTENSPAENSENGEPKKEENFAERARQEVAGATLEDPKMLDEFSKSLGLKNLSKDEAAQLSKLLANEKIDAENTRAQLTPEIKAILARRAAEDEQKKAA